MTTFQVELLISGPITITNSFRFTTDKELVASQIFNSEIFVSKHVSGIVAKVTVRTIDKERAYKVALLFVGRMLDILSIRTKLPLNATLNDKKTLIDRKLIRAVIGREELQFCFEMSRILNLNETKLLRSLNWYRKGLYTDDVFDKYLAFWNAISVVASGYHRPTVRTRLGIINQIYQCFIDLWGENQIGWPEIQGEHEWIDSSNGLRDKIAHGLIPVDIEHIGQILDRIEKVNNVAYRFLTEWSDSVLNINLLE